MLSCLQGLFFCIRHAWSIVLSVIFYYLLTVLSHKPNKYVILNIDMPGYQYGVH